MNPLAIVVPRTPIYSVGTNAWLGPRGSMQSARQCGSSFTNGLLRHMRRAGSGVLASLAETRHRSVMRRSAPCILSCLLACSACDVEGLLPNDNGSRTTFRAGGSEADRM